MTRTLLENGDMMPDTHDPCQRELNGLAPVAAVQPEPDTVVRVAYAICGVPRAATLSRCRHAVRARHVAANILRGYGLSFPEIARAAGLRCHTSAMYAAQEGADERYAEVRAAVIREVESARGPGETLAKALEELAAERLQRAALAAKVDELDAARRRHIEKNKTLRRKIERLEQRLTAATTRRDAEIAKAIAADVDMRPPKPPKRMERFGSMVVERLPDGRVVTRKVA